MKWVTSFKRHTIYYIYTLKGTKKLKDVMYAQDWKPVGSRAQYIKQWKSYRKPILKFTARTLWNMAPKKSILKMYSNKRYNLVINYARPKILKRKRDIYLKRPLKIKACTGSNFRVHVN